MNKLKSERGETLIESLVSLLVAVLAFAFLAMAAVSAEKINAKTRSTDVSFHYAETGAESGVSLKGEKYNREAKTGAVKLYENNGYYYYKYGVSENDTPEGGAS